VAHGCSLGRRDVNDGAVASAVVRAHMQLVATVDGVAARPHVQFYRKVRVMLRNLIATAALALGLSAVALMPAEARGGFGGGGFHGGGFGGGFHGGFGGFRGGLGGFHPGFGGAFRGAIRPGFGGGFHPGFGGFHNNRFFAGRFHNRFFPGVGVGALGGVYAGGYPDDYGYDYGYDYPYAGSGYCYLTRGWVWNGYRNVYRLVRVCQ
jgi:hypothetical protein